MSYSYPAFGSDGKVKGSHFSRLVCWFLAFDCENVWFREAHDVVHDFDGFCGITKISVSFADRVKGVIAQIAVRFDRGTAGNEALDHLDRCALTCLVKRRATKFVQGVRVCTMLYEPLYCLFRSVIVRTSVVLWRLAFAILTIDVCAVGDEKGYQIWVHDEPGVVECCVLLIRPDIVAIELIDGLRITTRTEQSL
jgi:hypothetical protein